MRRAVNLTDALQVFQPIESRPEFIDFTTRSTNEWNVHEIFIIRKKVCAVLTPLTYLRFLSVSIYFRWTKKRNKWSPAKK